MKALTLAGTLFVATAVAVGCSDRTKQEAREAGHEVAQAARATGDAVESAAHDAADRVKNASNDPSVKEAEQRAKAAVNEAAEAAGAAAQTALVKAALAADSKVDAGGIDVDSDGATRTVTLKGHVPSAAQKAEAGRIAAAKATSGYTVRNELTVQK